jgi:hypothetical protein
MWALLFLAWWRSGRATAARRRILGCVRASAYVAVVLIASFAIMARHAWARATERTVTLGKELMPLADMLAGTTAIRVNGEPLFFSMTVLRTPVHEALDRVQTNCAEHPGPLATTVRHWLDKIPAAAQLAGIRHALEQVAIARDETDEGGTVFCLTGNEGEAPRELDAELLESTSDLGALGNLRYVIASRGDPRDGEQDLTKIVAVWTEGHFRFDRLAPPPVGDAPGSDSSIMPRPPGGTRIFTAEAVDAPYSIRQYETGAMPADVLAFYDQAMVGWFPYAPEGAENDVRGYVKDGSPIMIDVTREESKTLVTLTEIGAYPGREMPPRYEPSFLE